MRRYTLRLPESLFQRLELMAENEGVSLNQFLIYSLTQTVSRAYQMTPVAPQIVAEHSADYDAYLTSLEGQSEGQTLSDEEFDAILDAGEPADLKDRVDPEIRAKIEAKIAAGRATRKKS